MMTGWVRVPDDDGSDPIDDDDDDMQPAIEMPNAAMKCKYGGKLRQWRGGNAAANGANAMQRG